MKKILLFLIIALTLLPGATMAQDSGMTELPDLGGQEITIAVENAYPPFNYLDEETGEPIGWDYDVIAEICARINCVPVYVETSWDGMILAVSNGEYDMAADGITITDERKEIVDYSDGYVSLEQKLLVRIDEDRFSSIEEFVANESLTMGTQPGTTNYFVAETYLGEGSERIVPYETFPIAVQAMIAGDVDAVILDDVAGQGYVGINGDKVKIVGEALQETEELGFIFPKGSPLRDAVNAALESMREDGTLLNYNLIWFAPLDLPDLGGQEITIAVENAYPPFNYLDEETGEPIGWDYEVLDEICVRLNCVPVYVETSWDGMILAVSNGEYDMAADGITITEERAEIVDYSDGYVSLVQRLLVRTDEERFSTFDEFAADESLTIGVQPGTTNFFVAEELLGEGSTRIIPYETFPIAVQAMIAGDVDAVILDDVAGQGYVGVNGDRVKITGEGLAPTEELGFIFPKGSPLRDAINLGLESMRRDGSLLELNLKWFAGVE